MEEKLNNTEELNEEEKKLPAQDDYRVMFGEGVHYYERRDYEKAASVFLNIYQKFPEQAEVLINYGNCQYELFNIPEAIKYWKMAQEKDKLLINSYINLGNYYLANKDYVAAEKEFEEAFCLNPYHEISLVNLGITYERLGKKRQAFTLYEFYLANSLNIGEQNYKNIHKKISLHKLNAISHMKLGIFFEKKGFFRKSLQSYFESLRVFPNFAKTYRNIGNIFYKLEKYNYAKLYWLEGYKLDKDDIKSCLNLALCFEKLGDKINAYSFYAHFIQKTSKQTQDVFLAQQTAEKLHQEIIALPEQTTAYKKEAETFITEEKFEEALIYYENLYLLSPQNEILDKINELKRKTNIIYEASAKSYEFAEELYKQGRIEFAMEKCKLANHLWRDNYLMQNISDLVNRCQTVMGNSLNNMLKAKH